MDDIANVRFPQATVWIIVLLMTSHFPRIGTPTSGTRTGTNANLSESAATTMATFGNRAPPPTTAPPSFHNLIPTHLQPSTLAPSLHGTPGYPSALIPPVSFTNLLSQSSRVPVDARVLAATTNSTQSSGLEQTTTLAAVAAASNPNYLIASAAISLQPIPLTVQDRPMTAPVYNGVNPHYPGLRVLHNSPPVFCGENFLAPHECDFLINAAHDSLGPAPVVGKGPGEISPSRTSSTCYLAREDLPDLMRKVTLLTGKPIDHCELPQVGRYTASQQYLQHYDAFDLSTEDGRRFASNGGQRTITVLIYLNGRCSHGMEALA